MFQMEVCDMQGAVIASRVYDKASWCSDAITIVFNYYLKKNLGVDILMKNQEGALIIKISTKAE